MIRYNEKNQVLHDVAKWAIKRGKGFVHWEIPQELLGSMNSRTVAKRIHDAATFVTKGRVITVVSPAGKVVRTRRVTVLAIREVTRGLKCAVRGTSDVDGTVVEYSSSAEAERLGGFDQRSINRCLMGRGKTHGLFKWERI